MNETLQKKIDEAEKALGERYEASQKAIDSVWHYCGLDAARSILTTQALWFTDILHLNDPAELNLGVQIFREVGESLVKGLSDDHPKRFLGPLIETFGQAASAPHRYYVASFSEADDDLPQWIAYADRGFGCAIEFLPDAFQAAAPGHQAGSPPMLLRVNYDELSLRR